MASGFIVMFFAAQVAASGLQAAPYWLIATYFLHTVGELCLSPVALSAVSKLSPETFRRPDDGGVHANLLNRQRCSWTGRRKF